MKFSFLQSMGEITDPHDLGSTNGVFYESCFSTTTKSRRPYHREYNTTVETLWILIHVKKVHKQKLRFEIPQVQSLINGNNDVT